MKKILIYGTGSMAEAYIKKIEEDMEIVSFVETVKSKKDFMGKPVISIDEIKSINFDEMHIVNSHVETIFHSKKVGVEANKIYVIMNETKLYSDRNIFYQYLELNHYICDVHFNAELIVCSPMLFKANAPYTKEITWGGKKIYFNKDYVRWHEFELLASEIEKNDVEGDCAELGVYQGQFASLINKRLLNKKLYLFDTFEGFVKKDIEIEDDNVGVFEGQLSDTSINSIISKMKYPNQVKVCKGWFPETIPNIDLRYAFVSLDCDLYAPTLAGLEYFYPRLSEGGYIMLHDYNGYFEKGIHKALFEYEKKVGRVSKVPVPDIAGSIVITK